jgi:hypothetical protein
LKFISSICLALAVWLNPKGFAAATARQARLEQEVARLTLESLNEDTGPLYAGVPDWSEDDAMALQVFLKTPTGQNLQQRFCGVMTNVALEGCKDEMHTTYSAANGNGWNEAYQWFVKLSRVSRVPDTKNEQPEEGAEQLLERWSP